MGYLGPTISSSKSTELYNLKIPQQNTSKSKIKKQTNQINIKIYKVCE